MTMSMRRALATGLAGLSLVGCAGLQSTDPRPAGHALTTAGFQTRPADTPEKLAQLRSLPPDTLMRRTHGGTTRYVYADPTSCKCLYVGGDAQYERLRRQEQAAADRFFAVEDSGDSPDFGLWEIGPR
jgi:hypothetical protein